MQVKIFTACFLGAFIGAFVALQMNPVFWWIGMPVGAFVAYISYEFKSLAGAIARSFVVTFKWRPNKSFWRAYFGVNFGVMGLVHSIVAVLILFAFILSGFSLEFKPITNEELSQILWLVVIFHVFIIFLGGLFFGDTAIEDIYAANLSYGKANPLALVFWYFPRGIWFIVKRIPKILGVIFELCILVVVVGYHAIFEGFKLVHSDIRLLCACDAAIGTIIGYFSGNAIIGGIVGGILGILDYELISKRLLRIEARR